MKKVFFKLNNLGLLVTAKGKVLINFQSRLFPIKVLDKTLTRESTPGPTTEPQVAKEPAAEPEVAKEPVKIKKKKKTKRKISSLTLCEKLLNEIKEEEKSINEQICNKFFNYHYQSFLLKHLYENNQNKNDKILKNMKKFPKQMLQRLRITIAQLKADNASKNLLNEIRQILYFCIKQKKLLKKYTTTNTINSKKL